MMKAYFPYIKTKISLYIFFQFNKNIYNANNKSQPSPTIKI